MGGTTTTAGMMVHSPLSLSTIYMDNQVSHTTKTKTKTKRWFSSCWCGCLVIALPINLNKQPTRSRCFGPHYSNIGFKSLPFLFPKSWFQTRRDGWRRAFTLDTSGISGNGEQESLNGDTPGLGGTRLGRIMSAGGRQLLEKLNSVRKNFPMKIFLLLLGFYTANALATILGQTGDWDVLVAGVVVAAIEGIGMLMYRKPLSPSTGRLQSFVVMVNYWKAGVCLGLFVDAFKLGS